MSSSDDLADHEPDLNALAALVEGRLRPAQRDELAGHLAQCVRCRTIAAELARARHPTRASRRWLVSALPLAAALAVTVAGATLYWTSARHDAMSPVVEAPPPFPTPPAVERPAAPPDARPEPSPPRATPDNDRTRGAGERLVAGKRFRLVAGEWIDRDYRMTDFFPVVDISTRGALDAHPALRPFTVLGSHFTVVLDGTVYRVALPASRR